jgi:hypothetical protein
MRKGYEDSLATWQVQMHSSNHERKRGHLDILLRHPQPLQEKRGSRVIDDLFKIHSPI